LGAVPLGKLQPAQIQAYYSEALSTGRRNSRGGLSAQTVVHHDRVLHVSVKRAKALRLISSNPVGDVSEPKVERQEVEVLDPPEGATLMTAAPTTRLFPIVLLALGTGLRRGEIRRTSTWTGAPCQLLNRSNKPTAA
jgi:hypothetical protein